MLGAWGKLPTKVEWSIRWSFDTIIRRTLNNINEENIPIKGWVELVAFMRLRLSSYVHMRAWVTMTYMHKMPSPSASGAVQASVNHRDDMRRKNGESFKCLVDLGVHVDSDQILEHCRMCIKHISTSNWCFTADLFIEFLNFPGVILIKYTTWASYFLPRKRKNEVLKSAV